MKPKNNLSRTKALIAIGMSAGLLMGQPSFASSFWPTRLERTKKNWEEDEPAKKTKNSKETTSPIKVSIKVYPDIFKRSMHAVTKSLDGAAIDFFVFDLNGTLIQHFKMKEKDHVKITGLAKGTYIYRVFAGDEETNNGQFVIK